MESQSTHVSPRSGGRPTVPLLNLEPSQSSSPPEVTQNRKMSDSTPPSGGSSNTRSSSSFMTIESDVSTTPMTPTTPTSPTTPTLVQISPTGYRYEHTFKVLIVGDANVGKTSLVKRYIYNYFSEDGYTATIGLESSLKRLLWDDHTLVNLQLWDIAGEERAGTLSHPYYKDAHGAIIAYDVSNDLSHASVSKWKRLVDDLACKPDGTKIPCVLVGNKCDETRNVTYPSRPQQVGLCEVRGFAGWFEVSAKEGLNVNEPFDCLIRKILQTKPKEDEEEKAPDTFPLEESTEGINHKHCNC